MRFLSVVRDLHGREAGVHRRDHSYSLSSVGRGEGWGEGPNVKHCGIKNTSKIRRSPQLSPLRTGEREQDRRQSCRVRAAEPTGLRIEQRKPSVRFAGRLAVASLAILSLAAPLSLADSPATAPATQPASIPEAVDRGVKFLETFQNPDGSWGTGKETRGMEIFSMVPGSLDAFSLGASALCVMALREAGEKTAHDKGLHYLLTASDARRDDGTLLYNTWAHIYVLQAMSEEMLHGNTDPHVAEVARRNLKEMIEYATYMGGWAYYDFHEHTQAPSMGPTSFGTAAGLVALFEAKQAGLDVPEKLINLSLHQLQKMRLPDGVFLYGADYKYIPRLPANRPRGGSGAHNPRTTPSGSGKPRTPTASRSPTASICFSRSTNFWTWAASGLSLMNHGIKRQDTIITSITIMRADCLNRSTRDKPARTTPKGSRPTLSRIRNKTAHGGTMQCGIITSLMEPPSQS